MRVKVELSRVFNCLYIKDEVGGCSIALRSSISCSNVSPTTDISSTSRKSELCPEVIMGIHKAKEHIYVVPVTLIKKVWGRSVGIFLYIYFFVMRFLSELENRIYCHNRHSKS